MQPNASLENLAERVQDGDALARAQLRARLRRPLAHIARRALGENAGASELARRIRATAHRLDAQSTAKSHLVDQVASNLCQSVVNRLWNGSTEGALQTRAT